MGRKNNINAKGRSKYNGEQHLKLTHHMMNHPNFRALKGNAVKVLLALCAKHNGFNNGRIFMSYDDMADQLYIGKTTAHRVCEELEYYGFIKMTRRSTFLGRRATEWEITFLKSEGYHPSHDWKKQKPRLRKRKKKPKAQSLEEMVFPDEEYQEDRARKTKSRYQNET